MNESLSFEDFDLIDRINLLNESELDLLDFGVIGFDAKSRVCRYNAYESQAAGLSATRVLGYDLFVAVAPCMNNYLVAQRFEDALSEARKLDETIDYVLTLRMRPVKVKLRLMASPASALRYVMVKRLA